MSTILVADDHPLNRHFLATLLSYHGHEIVETANGVEALESVRKRHFDLAIVDVAMPLMDGFTFVKALRAVVQEAFAIAIPTHAKSASRLLWSNAK